MKFAIIGLALSIALPGLSAPARGAEVAEPQRVVRIVSAPDLFNADVGDVRSARGWRRGRPNSWNPNRAAHVRSLFRTLADERASHYLVAGDLVNGHWDEDRGATGIFGPGDTHSQRMRRITRAGNLYYDAWRSFWADAGIPLSRVHPAVGDHKIGDNPWVPGTPKHSEFTTFKSVWARHLTTRGGRPDRYALRPRGTEFDDTAYATYLHPKVLLVTLDVFQRTGSGVAARVDGGQLAWLDGILDSVPDDVTTIVQGHTPILGPVRQSASSGLMLERGPRSPLWTTLLDRDVDLYLAGEVHADTLVQSQPGQPTQVSHGGLAGYGSMSWMTIDVMTDGSIRLETRRASAERIGPGSLWQTRGKIPAALGPLGQPSATGSAVVGPDRDVTDERGTVAPYRP